MTNASETMNKVVELGRAGKWIAATDAVRRDLFVTDEVAGEYVAIHSKEHYQLADEVDLTVAELEDMWGTSADEWGYLGPELKSDDVITFRWEDRHNCYRAGRSDEGWYAVLEGDYMPIDLIKE